MKYREILQNVWPEKYSHEIENVYWFWNTPEEEMKTHFSPCMRLESIFCVAHSHQPNFIL